ncbi:MAG: 30S ribosomal protein S9 [Gemmataceae bacterium]|jgi:small subunit ribosomal protein S9|nr:30S ribosomal protein S9 [Gemmataceae bacterium]
MSIKKVYLGTGRRKTSVARVRISEGSGKIIVNDRDFKDYFKEERDRGLILAPLQSIDMQNRVDVFIRVNGGGMTGQSGAACQGVARALLNMFGDEPTSPTPAPEAASTAEGEQPPVEMSIARKIRASGYLTRDSRMKERKKYGRKGARKSFQFSKR